MPSSRQMPVKVATAPISARPCVRRAISAPRSKSSRWMRTVTLSPRHRRKKRDLARAGNLRIGLHVITVDRCSDDVRVLERVGIFLAALRQPRNEVADRAHARRWLDLFLGLSDPFTHPREVEKLHVPLGYRWRSLGTTAVQSSIRCCTPARK